MSIGVAVLGTITLAAAWFWFRPDRLVVDDVVRDAAPARRTTLVATGQLRSLDHHTSGTVEVLQTGDGLVVRLLGLDTSNGPDLYLYLSTNPAGGPEAAFDDDGHVDLGRLRGNRGDANYPLPSGLDPTPLRSVVIWCDRFDSAFGAADLAAA